MKIFTHTLVIYDNGWCWKWKEKENDKNVLFSIDGSTISVLFLLIYVLWLC